MGLADYRYRHANRIYHHAYLWEPVKGIIEARTWDVRTAFDLGCGNGWTCDQLSKLGFEVTGVDPSTSGITQAKLAYAHVKAEIGSAYDDLTSLYGTFSLVISLEVIEHCMYPHVFARTFLSLIKPGGIGILSTPYHGYLKNLALAASGRMDMHFGALRAGGHVKFFSIATLSRLLVNAGAKNLEFKRVGRIPVFAKSMICIVHRD